MPGGSDGSHMMPHSNPSTIALEAQRGLFYVVSAKKKYEDT